jgi:hypothetical protein
VSLSTDIFNSRQWRAAWRLAQVYLPADPMAEIDTIEGMTQLRLKRGADCSGFSMASIDENRDRHYS